MGGAFPFFPFLPLSCWRNAAGRNKTEQKKGPALADRPACWRLLLLSRSNCDRQIVNLAVRRITEGSGQHCRKVESVCRDAQKPALAHVLNVANRIILGSHDFDGATHGGNGTEQLRRRLPVIVAKKSTRHGGNEGKEAVFRRLLARN